MPIHDWTRVESGLFHEFYQSWSVRIKDALNGGRMPKGYYALVEPKVHGLEPDVIAVETGPSRKSKRDEPSGGLALADPPRTKLIAAIERDSANYARRANRIVVRHHLGRVVAVIEIVSPGNKDSKSALAAFVQKAVAFLNAGVNLLIVDLFPPSRRDPQGVHKAIFDEFQDLPFELPAGKPLTLVSYRAIENLTAYIEPVAFGDAMPDMSVYLTPDEHVRVPFASTYDATWAVCPEPIRDLVNRKPPRRRR